MSSDPDVPPADPPASPRKVRPIRPVQTNGHPAKPTESVVTAGQSPAPVTATRTPKEKRAAFVKAYAVSRNITASCREVGIDRSTYYEWIKKPRFAAKVREAEQEYLDSLRAEIQIRSRDSDAVLMMRAKALLAEYKETVRQEIDRTDLPSVVTIVISDNPMERDEPVEPRDEENGA